jgi:hypothetical protein
MLGCDPSDHEHSDRDDCEPEQNRPGPPGESGSADRLDRLLHRAYLSASNGPASPRPYARRGIAVPTREDLFELSL